MKGFCVGKCVHQNLNLNPNGPELPETLKVWGEGQMAPTCNCFLLSWSLGHLGSIWTPFFDRTKMGQHSRGFVIFCPSVCLSVCPYVIHPSLSLLGLVVSYTANKPQTSDVAELGLTWQYTVDSIQQTVDSRQQTVDSRRQQGKGRGQRMRRRETIEPLEVCRFQHRYQKH